MSRRGLLTVVAGLGLLAGPVCGAGAAASAPDEPLELGVVSFYNPRLMYLKYQPLADYLGEHTGRRWRLRLGASYQQTVEELCSGRVSAAYLGPFTYVRAHEACGAEPVVRLRTGGSDTYRSYLLVRADSGLRKIEDLVGKRFGFGSPLSTSSHLVPRSMLEEAGIDVEADLECVYLDHHERAARAVIMGDVDACGVRDTVGGRFLERGLRVLARSKPIPNFPIVVSPHADGEIRGELVRALVEMPSRDPAIAGVMKRWDRELSAGFVPAGDAEYDEVRTLAKEVLGEGALALPEPDLRCAGPTP